MMDLSKIETLYIQSGKAIWKNGILTMNRVNAIDFINDCEAQDVHILGLDAFKIDDNRVRQFLDFSFDFSSSKYNSMISLNRYQFCKEHILNCEEDMLFEIIVS